MQFITEKTLRSMTDSGRHQRGRDYFNRGEVNNLREYRGKITATVSGYHDYRIKLWEEDGELECDCSCPDGQDYEFCKHCVAVGLTWLEKTNSASKTRPDRKPRKKSSEKITVEDIHTCLQNQNSNILAALLIEQAIDDEGLYKQLLLKVAADVDDGNDISLFK